MNLLLGIGLSIGLLVLLGVLMFVFYKKIPSNKLIVKYGALIKNGHTIKRGGGTFVLPIIQGVKTIDLELMNSDIVLREAYSKNKIPVNITADATFKVSSEPEEQKISAEALLDSGQDEIAKIANEIILGELRAVVANMTVDEINTNRDRLKEEASKNIEIELSKIGLDLKNLNLKSIADTAGVLEDMGKKSASEIKNKARVDVAEQNKFGRAESARLEAETIEMEKQAEVSREKAILDSKREIEKAQAESKKDIDIAKAESAREAEIATQLSLQKIKEQQIITTQKEAELKLEESKAEEIVAKKIENEKEILDNDARLKIERDKAKNDLEIAEKQAEAITIKAKAEADAMKLRAEAEAELLARPKERDAEAVAKLNEAMSGQTDEMTDFLLKQKYIEILPELVKAEADAVQSIGFKDITIIAGNGSEGQQALTNTVGDVMKSMPHMAFAMNMIKEINTKQTAVDKITK